MDRNMLRKVVSAVLSMVMIMEPAGAVFAAGSEQDTKNEEGYAPGEVIVMFKDGAVKGWSDSLRESRALPQVSPTYGLSLMASGDEGAAAEDAKSEADILEDILGDDFVLEDSIVFESSAGPDSSGSDGLSLNEMEDDGGFNVALVSSDKYDTEELIEKLSASKAIAAAEPNAYIYPTDLPDYSVDDTYNKYLYQLNSPAAHNNAGDDVADRGADPDKALSMNTASAWNKDYTEDERVVAVIDTGVLDTHEDLKNRMWENPGDIDLKGEHGYNFYENNEDSGKDDIGHGTHCAGVIAAETNNTAGIAGVAGNVNVKIMALKIIGRPELQPSTIYQAYGAFSYALRAKQRGVNVAATSNSWSSSGGSAEDSTIFDAIIDQLGEEGIITFVSAGNESIDDDRQSSYPINSNSEYTVVVGAADITGEPAAFSSYGKTVVDLYAPGVNILSTVGYDSYLPTIYTPDEITRTSDYYGEFKDGTVSEDKSSVTPVIRDGVGDSVKAFGQSQFRKQLLFKPEGDEADEEAEEGEDVADEARCELSIDDSGRYFSPDHKARLRYTIKNAQSGEEYFFYFPYEKNPETTGDADTKFSFVYESTEGDGGVDAMAYVGEVYEEDGELALTNGGVEGYGVGERLADVMTHGTNYLPVEPEESEDQGDPDGSDDSENPEDPEGDDESEDPDDEFEIGDRVMSYEEAAGRPVGIGIKVTGGINWEEGESHDLTFYIDSLGVSRPDVKIERTSSYEIMSGTSMACPAAAGAGALIAAMDPMKEGENGADYAKRIKSRLFSCVTGTDELKDLCSTGGYLDLSKIDEKQPAVSEAVCGSDRGTVTLKGENLYGCTVSYKRLAQEGAEETELPETQLSYSKDGNNIIISGAEELIGTYTSFTVTNSGGKKTESKFFLVNGLKKIEKIASKRGLMIDDKHPYPYYVSLVTDKDGKDLFGYDIDTGIVARFNGRSFDEIDGTRIENAMLDWLEEQTDTYTMFNEVHSITPDLAEFFGLQPTLDDGKLYQFVCVTMEDESSNIFSAFMDLSEETPEWEFRDMEDYPGYLIDSGGHLQADHVVLNGKVYMVGNVESGTEGTNVFACYDFEKNEWTRLADLPCDTTRQPQLYAAQGKIYYMFGHDVSLPLGLLDGCLVNDVWCYDPAADEWTKNEEIPFVGKYMDIDGYSMHFERAALAENGLVFVNTSVDGAGSCFLYNTETGKCEPMDYALTENLSDTMEHQSCVATQAGIYYIKYTKDEFRSGYELYLLPAESGAYRSQYAKLDKETASLKAGKELSLKVVSGEAASWKSSNKKVCTVKNGKVTALKKGTATVTATLTSGQEVTCKVKVTTSPKLSKKSITVKKGKTGTIKIIGKAKTVKNKYTNTKTAKVVSKRTASKIKVKGLKKGRTTLKIRVNGVTLKLKVTVK
ncbi:MAG: S8 family serine peptidase [Eubacterium sp.]|nr:S8 family serine peptidase [Eubacterium sp.]